MNNYFKQLAKDIDNYDLPKNLDNIDKVHTSKLFTGKRIYWYYEEDKKFFEDQGENIRDFADDVFSGICVPRPEIENNGGGLDIEDIIVVIDTYPSEKDYPIVEWTTMGRLLNDDDLVEIFEKE